MRTLLIAAAVLGLFVPAFATAEEPRPYDASVLPRDEAGLKALDDTQIRIVRRTTAQCQATEPALIRLRATQHPCIIGGVDHAIETSDDPALQAYHAALPFNHRYDRYRSSIYYQQMLVRLRQ